MCLCNSLRIRLISILIIFSILIFPFKEIQAQSVPVYKPSKVTDLVQYSIQKNLQNSGLAANDGKIGQTMQAIGNTTKATLSGAATGGATTGALALTAGLIASGPISWAAIGGAIILGSVAGGAGSLISNGLNWVFNSDKSVSVTQPAQASQLPGFTSGATIWSTEYAGNFYYSSSPDSFKSLFVENWANTHSTSTAGEFTNCQYLGTTSYACDVQINYQNGSNYVGGRMFSAIKDLVTYSCPIGAIGKNGGCIPDLSPQAPGQLQTQIMTLSNAINGLSEAQKAQQMSPEAIANIANAIWIQNSAQPGYQGAPFNQAQPVTAEQVKSVLAINPTIAPKLGDFIQTTSNVQNFAGDPTTTVNAPITNDNSNITYNTTNTTKNEQKIDFGNDPGIGTPGLEDTPTGSMITDPILNMLPTFKNWSMPAHNGECPVASFNLLGHFFNIDYHCTLFNQVGSIFQGVSTAMWAFLAITIVLGA